MIPVIIEPTKFSFDVLYEYFDIPLEDEIYEFRNFAINLMDFFKQLKDNNLGIAITNELLDYYLNSVPVKIYQNEQPSIVKLAYDLFIKQIKTYSKVIHKSENVIQVDFSLQHINRINSLYTGKDLHDSDAYVVWKQLLLLMTENKLLPLIIKDSGLTIFNQDNSVIIRTDINKRYGFECYLSVNELLQSKHIQILSLFKLQETPKVSNVSCSGTGDHSSMWDKRIEKLSDVPALERDLLKKIIELGIVKKIKFLDFGRSLSVSDQPKIEMRDIKEEAESDLIEGFIHSKGSKQNAQNIIIEVNKGYGHLINEVFSGVITMSKLTEIKKSYEQLLI